MSLKDKILTWGSALTFNFLTSFSWATVVFTLAIRVILGHEISLLELSLSLAKLSRVLSWFLSREYSGPLWVAPPNSMAEGDDNTCLYLQRTNRDQWIELVYLSFSPTCVLHGGTSTCLRVNLNLLCAIWADGYTAQINLKTQSKPMVWSDAYKCFFSVYYMKCVILRWVYWRIRFSKNK